MVDEPKRKSVRMNLTDALANIERIMALIGRFSALAAECAKDAKADPATVALAVLGTGYVLVRFSSKPEEAERRYWEAARLAKELFDMSEKKREARAQEGSMRSQVTARVIRVEGDAFYLNAMENYAWPIHERDRGRIEEGDVVTLDVVDMANQCTEYTLVRVSKGGNPAFQG